MQTPGPPPAAGCPGTQSDQAGKADSCQGCPNQGVCSSLPKGPDPGTAGHAHNYII